MCDFNLPNCKLGNQPDSTTGNLSLSGKLIAWLDGELPDHEAVLVERHVGACAECRSRLDAYERVSSALNEYCDAAVASKTTALETPLPMRAAQTPKATQGTLRRWVPAFVGAAAALAALFLAFPRTRVEWPGAPPQAAAVVPSAAPDSLESLIASAPGPAPALVPPLVTPAKTVRKPHAARPTQTPGQTREQAPSRAPRPSQILDAGWVPASPAIRIAIPAEAMFPPGAVPEGVNFTADFSIAADGSAAPLRLQPRPSGTPMGTPIGTAIGSQVHYERKPTQP